MGTPLVIVAETGAAAEVVGIVQNPRDGSVDYQIAAIVGTGDLLADIADRLAVPLLDQLTGIDVDNHVALSGGGSQRLGTIATMETRGLTPATLIHADTTVGPWVSSGPGSVVGAGVRITGNVAVGSFCQLHTGAILSHDDVLADNVTLSPGVTLCGGVQIGAGSVVFAGATVMPGVTIGTGATIGAGALVNKDVAAGTTVVGVPAKQLG